jgi:dihydrolipoamide dehydrogenase
MAEAARYDVVFIGGGPGGYVGAIRAAQLGMKVACVEKRDTLGGTCLNVGCIPSKALLESSEVYHTAKEGLAEHGVSASGVKLDLAAMMARKERIVGESTRGIDGLFKKHRIARYVGTGRIASPTEVEITGAANRQERVAADTIVIATGSEPVPLPGVPFDGKRVISSTDALALGKVPKHLIVVGGGVIGMELGSVWRRLGAEVAVVEMLPQLFGTLDGQIARAAHRIFTKQGFKFHLGARVTAVKPSGSGVLVACQDGGGKPVELTGDAVLVAIGRRPHSEGLGAKEAGVAFDDKGRIKTNSHFETNVRSIRAIGDAVAGVMLAHKAMDEGIAVAELLAGQPGHVNYEAIPSIVYTHPEIAWVGRGEEELKAQGREFRVGTYPFTATPRAKTLGETEGMVKIVADAKTDRLLGFFIIGPRAGDLIAEAALAFEFGASAEDIARSVHAHPTLAEAVKEAALAVDKRTIHM